MNRRVSGFTLVELLTAVAVLAAMLAVGVPALRILVQRAREANAYHLLTASLASARMAAMQRREAVAVCPSDDGVTCRGDVAWEHGWIVFLDPERQGQPSGPDAVLQHADPIGPGLTLRSTMGRRLVRFSADGWALGSNLSVRLCKIDGSQLLGKVVVNNAGRPRTERARNPKRCPYRP